MRENLRAARKAKGMTQQQVADKLECAADDTILILSEIVQSGEIDANFFMWLRKFLIRFDERYCDVLAQMQKTSL